MKGRTSDAAIDEQVSTLEKELESKVGVGRWFKTNLVCEILSLPNNVALDRINRLIERRWVRAVKHGIWEFLGSPRKRRKVKVEMQATKTYEVESGPELVRAFKCSHCGKLTEVKQ
jgi:hypothetical protein